MQRIFPSKDSCQIPTQKEKICNTIIKIAAIQPTPKIVHMQIGLFLRLNNFFFIMDVPPLLFILIRPPLSSLLFF